MKITFLKIQKPRQFRHVPIYYDERKEELNSIVRKAESDLGIKADKGAYVPSLKGQIKRKHRLDAVSITKYERLKSNVRLVIIIGVLLVVAYFLLNSSSDYLNMLYSTK